MHYTTQVRSELKSKLEDLHQCYGLSAVLEALACLCQSEAKTRGAEWSHELTDISRLLEDCLWKSSFVDVPVGVQEEIDNPAVNYESIALRLYEQPYGYFVKNRDGQKRAKKVSANSRKTKPGSQQFSRRKAS